MPRILSLLLAGVLALSAQPLFELSKNNKDLLRVATLFTAHAVRDHLSAPAGLDSAVRWCKDTGITHVYLETVRMDYQAERDALVRARDRFSREGFDVSGCVTTKSPWCYSDPANLSRLREIFEFTAGLFDHVIIDDFFFTACECDRCRRLKGARSWSEFRRDLMLEASKEHVLEPARKVNPNVVVNLKYPLWYENYHERGYDVIRQTELYDEIFVGTETRDWGGPRGDRKPQYQAYFLMRWLGGIGGEKTKGGWFDYIDTTEDTYVEQAWQTVLADAPEIFLFTYHRLLEGGGAANVRRFRKELPGIFELAELVRGKPIRGVTAVKPPHSNGYVKPDSSGLDADGYVFSLAGMIGLPLVPRAEVDTNAPSALFSMHALADSEFPVKLRRMLDGKKPVAVTDGLASQLAPALLNHPSLMVLPVGDRCTNLLYLGPAEMNAIRDHLLAPFGMRFNAPGSVALYLYGGDLVVIENFNTAPVRSAVLEFDGPVTAAKALALPKEANVAIEIRGNSVHLSELAARSLVALRINR